MRWISGFVIGLGIFMLLLSSYNLFVEHNVVLALVDGLLAALNIANGVSNYE